MRGVPTALGAPLLHWRQVYGREGAPCNRWQHWHLRELVEVTQRLNLGSHGRRRDRVVRLRLGREVLVPMLLRLLRQVQLWLEVALVERVDGCLSLVAEVVVHHHWLGLRGQLSHARADWLQVRMACWVGGLSGRMHGRQVVALTVMLKLWQQLVVGSDLIVGLRLTMRQVMMRSAD